MADFSGIGAFASGAMQGYDQSLSRYGQLDQIMRARQAEERARQQAALQSLLHGTQLASTNPDIAEAAAGNPAYGLNPQELGPGIEAARRERAATARLTAALQAGNLESVANDPEVGNVLGKNIKVYGPMIKEINDRRIVDRIVNGPGTPQEKARALLAAGVKTDAGLLTAGYPELKGAEAEATAGGTARGQIPYAGVLEEAKALGRGKGELATAGPLSQAKKTGELTAELSPDITPPGVPLGSTSAGRLAQEKETPAQRAVRTRNAAKPVGGELGPKDVSMALNRVRQQARNEVGQMLTHAKPVFDQLPSGDQQQIIEYYTAVKQQKMAEQDPVLAGQSRMELPPKPDAVVRFEGQAQSSGFGNFLKGLFGFNSGETVPAPRSLRQSAPAAPASAGGWGRAEVVR